jgi:hypothetical protein
MYFCVVLCIFCVVLCILCCSMYFLCCSMYFCVILCIFVLFYVLFCDVLCIVCVYMCTVLLPPGGYPIAVKYNISSFFFTVLKSMRQFHTSTRIRTCLTIFLTKNYLHFLLRRYSYTWIFSDIFTFTSIHYTSLTRRGRSYFTNLINHIRDWLTCWMGTAVMSDWLCCCFTWVWCLEVRCICQICMVILYFWPSGFTNLILLKTNRRRTRATCTRIYHCQGPSGQYMYHKV